MRSLEIASIHGLVALLCNARLATLLAVGIGAMLGGTEESLALVLAAVLPSWLPLRHWSRRPALFHRSVRFLAIDSVVTVIVVWLCVVAVQLWELGVCYLILSSGLAGAMARRGSAILATALVCAVAMPILSMDAEHIIWTMAAILGAVGVAYGMSGLSFELRRQGALARRLVQSQAALSAQEERADLAREMHDSVAKTLHGVDMMLGTLTVQLEDEESGSLPLASMARDACKAAKKEARDVLSGLRAAHEESLVQSLRLTARRWTGFSQVPVDLRISPAAEAVDVEEGQVHHLRRIVTELLENVHRHARAKQVMVSLDVDGNNLHLVVEDDGIGMPRITTEKLALAGHYGVVGVQERARAIAGSVTFEEASRSRGTRVEVQVPLHLECAQRQDIGEVLMEEREQA